VLDTSLNRQRLSYIRIKIALKINPSTIPWRFFSKLSQHLIIILEIYYVCLCQLSEMPLIISLAFNSFFNAPINGNAMNGGSVTNMSNVGKRSHFNFKFDSIKQTRRFSSRVVVWGRAATVPLLKIRFSVSGQN
jgi:hypothetical protein